MKATLLAVTLAIASSSSTFAAFVPIGGAARATADFPACRVQQDLQRIKELLRADGTDEAALKYVAVHACKIIRSGTIGVVDDGSIYYGSSCIRERGEPDCYWFPNDLISGK